MRRISTTALLSGLVLGVGSLAIARAHPFDSFAGDSPAGAVALVGAGWSMVVCGVIAWRRRPQSRFGRLLVAGGIAWLLVELDNPEAGSAVVFTIGLITFAAAPPVLGHAALTYPGGHVTRRSERVALAIAYASALGVQGLAHALVFAPSAEGCFLCPSNLLAVHAGPAIAHTVESIGVVLGVLWSTGLIVVLVLAIARASPAARLVRSPVLIPAIAYMGLVTAEYARSVSRGTLSNDDVDRALWMWQALALGAVVLGVIASRIQARRSRTAVARLAVELGEAPPLGRLRDVLSRALGDPRLELAFPIGEDRYVNGDGERFLPTAQAGMAVTPMLRGSHTVALLVHRAELLDDPTLLEEVGGAARLVLEHERLQAEARAQIAELHASRAGALCAGDAERRRLERDLHDGAQQRLVGISLALRVARAQLTPCATTHLDAADEQLRGALGDLRELARGIYPAALGEAGLPAALEALAESAPVPIVVGTVPEARLPEAVEAAAYFLVDHVLRHAAPARLAVRAGLAGQRLTLDLAIAGDRGADLSAIDDRVGALDGTVVVAQRSTGMTIHAEIPCES